MPRAKSKTRKPNPERAAVLTTSAGELLTIGSDPTVEAVRGFVEEHNRRYHAGEAAGPSGGEARLVTGAYYFEAERPAGQYDLGEGEPIDLGDSLNSGRPSA